MTSNLRRHFPYVSIAGRYLAAADLPPSMGSASTLLCSRGLQLQVQFIAGCARFMGLSSGALRRRARLWGKVHFFKLRYVCVGRVGAGCVLGWLVLLVLRYRVGGCGIFDDGSVFKV